MKLLRLLLLSVGITNAFGVHAQVSPPAGVRQLSAGDSATLHRYMDGLNNTTLFSLKRQRYYDSALGICPWKAHWWQQKATPLFKQRKYELGMPCLDSAVKYDAASYIDYRAFMKCIFQKSYRDAIPDFEQAKIIIGAGSVMDHDFDFYIGLCYLQLDQLDSAKYYLSKTINTQRKTLGEHYVHFLDIFYLGIAYYEEERYDDAIKEFDTALHLYTNFSDAKYYKAECLKRLHHDEEALALMKDAQADFKQGYTFTEDNAIYETYPY